MVVKLEIKQEKSPFGFPERVSSFTTMGFPHMNHITPDPMRVYRDGLIHGDLWGDMLMMKA